MDFDITIIDELTQVIRALRKDILEVKQRTRRVETRTTKLGQFLGFDMQVAVPTWQDGVILIPSKQASAESIRAAFPEDWPTLKCADVIHKGELVFTVSKE